MDNIVMMTTCLSNKCCIPDMVNKPGILKSLTWHFGKPPVENGTLEEGGVAKQCWLFWLQVVWGWEVGIVPKVLSFVILFFIRLDLELAAPALRSCAPHGASSPGGWQSSKGKSLFFS